ncbi:MAG: alpha/beta fold hydrolase [Pirellulales bacterium]
MNCLGLFTTVAATLLAAGQLPEGVEKQEVVDEAFVADFYTKQDAPPAVGVLVLGGSEGGKPSRLAQGLAAKGFAVLAVAYFKAEGTPDYLDMIPLEYFEQPLEWLASQEAVRDGKIVVIGGSKGGELALLLASRHPEIAGVVAISPSSVVFQGIPKVFWPPRSSWSYHGEPIPFVPYDYSQPIDTKNLLPLYQRSLQQDDAVARATIPVERIGGPVLLFSGVDDTMWPATDMCDDMVSRLRERAFAHEYQHVDYPNAGHTLNEQFMLGGTRG